MDKNIVKQKLYEKYIEPTKKKRNSFIGVEIEIPILNLNKKEVDFDMKLNIQKTDYINGKATLLDCIKSPSIYAFYAPLILFSVVGIVVKFLGVI